jgi:hypothetical protein
MRFNKSDGGVDPRIANVDSEGSTLSDFAECRPELKLKRGDAGADEVEAIALANRHNYVEGGSVEFKYKFR